MAVNLPTIATTTARTRSGAAFTGVFGASGPNAFTLATVNNRNSLSGGPPGLAQQITVPVNIGRFRRIVPLGLFST